MVDISRLTMVYKPTYNWGGAPPCRWSRGLKFGLAAS